MQVRQGCRSSPERARPEDMCRIYGSLSVFAKNVNKCLSFIYILQLSSTSTACQAPRVLVFHQHQDSTVTRRAIPHKGGADISSSLHQECNAAKSHVAFLPSRRGAPYFQLQNLNLCHGFHYHFFLCHLQAKKQKTKTRTPQQKINRFTAAVWAVQNVILGNAEMKLVTQKITEYKL